MNKTYQIVRLVVLAIPSPHGHDDVLYRTGRLRVEDGNVMIYHNGTQTWVATDNTIGMIKELLDEGRIVPIPHHE